LRPFGFQFLPAIRQQVQTNLVARPNTEMLQHILSEGDLAPDGDRQGRHGGFSG
jgi:hypothetical protein